MKPESARSFKNWGPRASLYLLKDLNCSVASLEAVQDMIGRKEDRLLKAVTGLEGGVVGSGSTCGVVTGGALGLALMHERELAENGVAAEAGLLCRVGEYAKWFEGKYGTTFCKNRVELDFHTAAGQARYLLPGDRVARCLFHMGGAVGNLSAFGDRPLPRVELTQQVLTAEPVHCARAVLGRIRERTGVGDPLLERISVALDGGVGLQGGVCGALAGAIMAVNLLIGMNVREEGYLNAVKSFAIGHLNLLRQAPIGALEPFCVGKDILHGFRREIPSLRCGEITGRPFSSFEDFHQHLLHSDRCQKLIDLAVDLGAAVIDEKLSEYKSRQGGRGRI